MKLYHFTSLIHIEIIEREGLTKGEIPITPHQLENGVWLTANASPTAQGWGRESLIHGAQDKQAVRLTIEIDDNDTELKRWPVWAKERRISTSWYRKLDRSGGGGSLNWYVYLGHIPIERITKIERLRQTTLEEFHLIKKLRAGELETGRFIDGKFVQD